jgi:hypothetical protein
MTDLSPLPIFASYIAAERPQSKKKSSRRRRWLFFLRTSNVTSRTKGFLASTFQYDGSGSLLPFLAFA